MRVRGAQWRSIVLAFLVAVVVSGPAGAVRSVPATTADLGLPKKWDATFTGWERHMHRPKLDMRISAHARFVLSKQDAYHAEYVTTGGSASWQIKLENAHGDHDGENGRIGNCTGSVTITRPVARGDGRLSLRPDDLFPSYHGLGYPRANPARFVVPVSCIDADTGERYGDTSTFQAQVWWQGVGTPTRYDRLEGSSRYEIPGASEEEYHWRFSSVIGDTRVRVASLDFAATPVIRDGMNAGGTGGPRTQTLEQYDDGCGRARVEWRDCRPSMPDGASEKSWPMIVTGGERLNVAEAVFKVEGPERLTTATVTGAARIGGGATITLRSSRVTRRGDRLVVRGLTSTAPLPRRARAFSPLTIAWKVKTRKRTYDAGSSRHTVYVTWRPLLGTRPEARLLSIVDLAAQNTNGAATEAAVVAGIWQEFEGRSIFRRSLDPATGTVSVDPGGLLQYWSSWSFADELINRYSCPDSQSSSAIIDSGIGRCGGWAEFLVDVLASEGIRAQTKGLELPPSVAGPPGALWMLVKNWSFGTPSGSGDFPYVTDVYDCPSGLGYGKREFVDQPGIAAQGARAVTNTRGWFKVNDHAYVVYGNRIYDPSYGTGPFASVEEWAHASLDGFASATSFYPWLHNFELCTAWLVTAHKGF